MHSSGLADNNMGEFCCCSHKTSPSFQKKQKSWPSWKVHHSDSVHNFLGQYPFSVWPPSQLTGLSLPSPPQTHSSLTWLTLCFPLLLCKHNTHLKRDFYTQKQTKCHFPLLRLAMKKHKILRFVYLFEGFSIIIIFILIYWVHKCNITKKKHEPTYSVNILLIISAPL